MPLPNSIRPALPVNKTSAYIKYWAAYVLLFTLIQGYPAGEIRIAFINELISLPPKILFVYLVMEWLVVKYLMERKFLVFSLIYLVLIVACAIAQRFIDNYILLEYFLTHWQKDSIMSAPVLVYNIIKLQFVVAVPFSFLLFYNWMQEKNRVRQIHAEKMEAELKFLRNQLQPHFLFNVLNNLYSSVLQKSEEAPGMVLKLSTLLQYSLYESNQQAISAEKELRYISDYVDLQMTRLNHQLDLSFHVEGDLSRMKLIPFILIPFVENSFKHAKAPDSGLPWITIYIEANDGWLYLKIENSLDPHHEQEPASARPPEARGIGLENVKRRLELLYPQAHVLKISETSESYFVSLKIKPHDIITSHQLHHH